MIATPAYEGKLTIPYTLSFARTIQTLHMNDIQVTPLITSSGSLLVAERNRIIDAFWNSECTHLLCIDSDLGWPEQAVLAMLEVDKEFVAGVYPARGEPDIFLFRPALNENNSVICDKHLLKVEYIPSGFILLSRSLIEKMRNKFPELYFESKNKESINANSGYCFFDTEVWEGEFWGEDYVFCRRAREAGAEIWVDPLIQFDHAGTVGMLIQILSQSPDEFKPVLGESSQ